MALFTDSEVDLYGYKIYGTPWQLPFWGAFNLDDKNLIEKYNKIPPNVDIVLSHGPLFGIFDEVPYYIREIKLIQHTGSHSLRRKIFEIKPVLFVCGHIHCSYGVCKIEETTFANVCLLNDQLEVSNQPVVFDY